MQPAPPHSTRTDEVTLILRARTEPDAFAILYERHVNRIFAFIRRRTLDEALAQDITADTFEKALHHLRSHNWREGPFAAWLYRIALNQLRQHFRRKQPLPLEFMNSRGADPVEDQVIGGERDRSLLSALRCLAPSDQQLLGLRFLDGLTALEIALALGLRPPTVHLRVHRALRRLRRFLEKGALEEASHGPS
jgi:RNA polymerase sigma-70 factor (ECF subfamily)